MRDELPEFLRLRDIRERIIGIGRRTAQRWIAAGSFPRPDLVLGGINFWKRETVMDWLEKKTAGGESGGKKENQNGGIISRKPIIGN